MAGVEAHGTSWPDVLQQCFKDKGFGARRPEVHIQLPI